MSEASSVGVRQCRAFVKIKRKFYGVEELPDGGLAIHALQSPRRPLVWIASNGVPTFAHAEDEALALDVLARFWARASRACRCVLGQDAERDFLRECFGRIDVAVNELWHGEKYLLDVTAVRGAFVFRRK